MNQRRDAVAIVGCDHRQGAQCFKLKAFSRGLARFTMTALAVAYGYKFGGMSGTVIALTALSLPVFVLTIALTIAYHYLRNSRLFDFLPVTIMPAALALIVVAALKLGKDVFHPSRELLIACAAFALALFLRLNPALILLVGGALGAFVLQKAREEAITEKKDANK